MNLFYLHEEPVQAAMYNCDVHCNKMLLELVQILVNCFPESELPNMPLTQKNTIRKYSHYNHPTSKWVRQNTNHIDWTIRHAKQLEEERILRGMNPHFVSDTLQWIVDNRDRMIKYPTFTFVVPPPAIATTTTCRQRIVNFDSKNRVDQYRLYYVFDKPFASWTYRDTPEWFSEMKQRYHLTN